MKIDLTGKVALVTASTGGIGFAIARGLAESGAEVIVNGRSIDSVNKGIQALQQVVPGVQVRAAIADLSSQEGVDELLRVATHVDILVNNAGIYGQQDFYSTDDETWERYWQTNVMSGVRLSRALLPGMVQKGWGRVVFISSESACNIPADMIHYGVTKTAQLSLARGLAKFVEAKGVAPRRSVLHWLSFPDKPENFHLFRRFSFSPKPAAPVSRTPFHFMLSQTEARLPYHQIIKTES